MPAAPQSQVRLATVGSAHEQSRADDSALVTAALSGDARAARSIVERHTGIVRLCLRSSLPEADIDDGLQVVFARCFEYLPRLRERASLRSFIIGIALRFGAMERRRRRNRWREHLTATGDLPEILRLDDPSEPLDVALRTRTLLARLSPEARSVIELRFVHEKELTEVAGAMGMSLATVKRHLGRVTSCFRAMAKAEPALNEYLAS